MFRILLLTIGPVLLVSASYWATMSQARKGLAATSTSQEAAAHAGAPIDSSPADSPDPLEVACQQKAAELAPRLGDAFHILIHSPFVLAGNLSEAELHFVLTDTILPTYRALTTTYFDTLPSLPVTIVLCADERTYRESAMLFDHRPAAHYYGYFIKDDLRVVLNLSTGNGTLAHELAHVLSHFDFPRMPEWFDEGLASLHEHCEFSENYYHLKGLSNWRVHYVKNALKAGNLRTIGQLISSQDVRPEYQAVDYAHARYFCLYLQQQQLLAPFYRKFRASVDVDPTGLQTLEQLIGERSVADLDREFRLWLADGQFEQNPASAKDG